MIRRVLLLTVAVLALGALLAGPASAASYRLCPPRYANPDNGIIEVYTKRLKCSTGAALAQHVLDVKCFLNRRYCVTTFRGLRWKCRASKTFESYRCTRKKRGLRVHTPG